MSRSAVRDDTCDVGLRAVTPSAWRCPAWRPACPLGQALPVPPHPQALLPGGTKPEEGVSSLSCRAAPGILSEHLSEILGFGS